MANEETLLINTLKQLQEYLEKSKKENADLIAQLHPKPYNWQQVIFFKSSIKFKEADANTVKEEELIVYHNTRNTAVRLNYLNFIVQLYGANSAVYGRVDFQSFKMSLNRFDVVPYIKLDKTNINNFNAFRTYQQITPLNLIIEPDDKLKINTSIKLGEISEDSGFTLATGSVTVSEL